MSRFFTIKTSNWSRSRNPTRNNKTFFFNPLSGARLYTSVTSDERRSRARSIEIFLIAADP